MAASNQQPFEVDDFSLGICDDPFEADPRLSIELDNFVIDSGGGLLSRHGSVVEDTTNPQIPAGIKRIGALINYDNDSNLLVQSEKKVYYRNPSAYATLTGPSSNDVFSSGDEDYNTSFSEWNKQVYITHDNFPRPMKIYKDSGGTLRVNTSGLPALATSPTVTPVAGAEAFIYAFHYEYQYTVGSQTYEDVGPVTEVSVTSAAAPNVSTIAITNIPVIANGVTDNWDTGSIKVNIYRTTNGGTTLFYVGQVTNGTTSYNDTSSDTTIQTHVLLYTEDGTVEFDPVPLHKYVHIINGVAYYAYLKEDSVEYPFVARQSIPGNPSAVPADNDIITEDTITGVGSVVSIPLLFCNRHVYRVEGSFDQFGKGKASTIRISDTAGCKSHNSIVSAEGKCFWFGVDGVYMTDGYKVNKISDKLNLRYKALLSTITDTKRISGKFDKENRRIIWTIQSDSSSLENDSILVLHLEHGLRSHSSFTTWSGESFRPASIEFYNGVLYRGDNSGYVYYHDEDVLADPKVDTTEAAADWNQETIIWNYKSLNYNFGSSFYRKMPTRILLTARNIANTSIQINSIDDDDKRTRALKPIRWRRNFIWGDVNFVWGSLECIWKSLGVIEQWRRFPARGLRLSYCQIQITNAYSVVSNSDILGEALFDGPTSTAVITNSWPTDSVDYYISTEYDNYAVEYQVQTIDSSTQITVIDSSGSLPNGTYKWLLKGYKKSEPLSLQGYCIHFGNVDQNQRAFHTTDEGSNA